MAKLVDVVEISTEVLLDILVEAGYIDDTFLDGEIVDVNITRGDNDSVLQLHVSTDVELNDVVFSGEDDQCDECCICEIEDEEDRTIDYILILAEMIYGEVLKLNKNT